MCKRQAEEPAAPLEREKERDTEREGEREACMCTRQRGENQQHNLSYYCVRP
jgi:hypothetical protein